MLFYSRYEFQFTQSVLVLQFKYPGIYSSHHNDKIWHKVGFMGSTRKRTTCKIVKRRLRWASVLLPIPFFSAMMGYCPGQLFPETGHTSIFFQLPSVRWQRHNWEMSIVRAVQVSYLVVHTRWLGVRQSRFHVGCPSTYTRARNFPAAAAVVCAGIGIATDL